MNDASGRGRTDKMRFLFEEDGGRLLCYEARLNPPQSCTQRGLSDIESQMARDGLSFEEIAGTLGHCAQQNPDVEMVSIHHAGSHYSVVVVLRELSDLGLVTAYFVQACDVYGRHRPIVSVLGPEQRDCRTLSASGSRTVYASR